MKQTVLFLTISLFLFIPLSPPIYMHGHTDSEWEAFTQQYQLLQQDGKHSLATKLLHNREQDMAQYVMTLSNEDQRMWTALVRPLMDGQASELEVDRFVTYSMAVKGNKEKWMEEEVLYFQELIQDPQIDNHNILTRWESVAPVFYTSLTEKEFSGLNQMMLSLQGENVHVLRQELLTSFNTISTTSSMKEDALLWTALIIGGFIILTLTYVAVKKYKAMRGQYSREKH